MISCCSCFGTKTTSKDEGITIGDKEDPIILQPKVSVKISSPEPRPRPSLNSDLQAAATTALPSAIEKAASSKSRATTTSKTNAGGLKSTSTGGMSPNSSSCPQLTVDEVQESTEEYGIQIDANNSSSSQKCPQKSSFVTKTYSFRRILSFRGSLRGRGGRMNLHESEEGFQSSPMMNPGLSSLQPNHRPLQFSFLGQIYKNRSTKRQKRSASQKVSKSSDFDHQQQHQNHNKIEYKRQESNGSESQETNSKLTLLSTQVILEN